MHQLRSLSFGCGSDEGHLELHAVNTYLIMTMVTRRLHDFVYMIGCCTHSFSLLSTVCSASQSVDSMSDI